jgi:hypothetical protein
MARSIELNEQQAAKIIAHNRQAVDLMLDAGQPGLLPASRFVFFAAFDGTNNTLNNHPQANAQPTNVAQLWTQYQMSDRYGGGYFVGPGAPGTLSKSDWVSTAVTQQVQITAENAYVKFMDQALQWLAKPGAEQAVSVVISAFSRGNASAAIFSQLLYDRGLSHPDGYVLIAPQQIRVSAGVLFDPVTTAVTCSVAFAPNSVNIVCMLAMNEYRYLFPSTQYPGQVGISTINMVGNHCDIGGGYDNGLAALSLDGATRFLRACGLDALGEVPANRQFNDPGSKNLVHSEGAPSGVQDPQRPWDAYREFECNPEDFLATTRLA